MGECFRCWYFLASEVAEFYTWRWLETHNIEQKELGRVHAKYLADAIFDYLAVASLGEARHSYYHCYDAKVNLPHDVSRETIYKTAFLYDPKQFLPVLSKLFNNYDWASAYGGKAWGKAVDIALKYLKGELTPVLFVDSAIWLHHNTGVIFNKPLIFKDGGKNVFKSILDAKRKSKTPLQFIKWYYVSRPLQQILQTKYNISCQQNYLSMLDKGYRKFKFKGEKELKLYEKGEKGEKKELEAKSRVS